MIERAKAAIMCLNKFAAAKEVLDTTVTVATACAAAMTLEGRQKSGIGELLLIFLTVFIRLAYCRSHLPIP